MDQTRTALYLDFDNVFGGLARLDPDAALMFAKYPSLWLRRLATSLMVRGERRWLILRCYMNPAGWVPNFAGNDARLYFSGFREAFTRAGFEVVDCPRLTLTKNAADIQMVIDAVDALTSSTCYDEFVIASGDADMTPLLRRLRAADRRTTIVSPNSAAEAFTSIADQLIAADQILALVQGEKPETLRDDEPIIKLSGPETPTNAEGSSETDHAPTDDSYSTFADLVYGIYDSSTAPITWRNWALNCASSLVTTGL